MARITQITGAAAVLVAVGIHVYFNVWHEAYYYPGAYETGFAATGIAFLIGGLGLVGSVGATFVLWRRRSFERKIANIVERPTIE